MTIHQSVTEQVLSIKKLFSDCSCITHVTATRHTLFIAMDDIDSGFSYASLLMASGWIALCFKNPFCSKCIIAVELHRS